MSNVLNEASLVLIPSGYKAGKVYSQIPENGNGDLDFTRSNDTATRVNSAGLIEKVRTNLVLRSEEFDNAAWFTSGATLTSGQPDPFGGNDAFLVEFTGATTDAISQNVSMVSGIPYAFSVYIKGVDLTALRLNIAANLVVVSSQINNGTWVRISGSATAGSTSSLLNQIRAGNSAGESFFIYAAQIETGDIATDYIPTTTTAVSVGMTANVPRLDYSGGGCPKLLLEPQRTNLVTFSEQFDNAAWTKTAVNVTANNAVSPDGYNNAEKITETATTGIHRVFQNASVSAGNNTFSFFVKKDERSSIEIVFGGTAYPSNYAVLVNLDTQVVTGNTADITTSIVDFGNGWLRCSFTSSASSSASSDIQIYLRKDGVSRSYAGDGTSGLYLWGCQLEAGSYVSSYIPTLGAAVTRGADACSKTGISSLIGQTEGTLFLEMRYEVAQQARLTISDGTGNNWIFFSYPESTNNTRVRIAASGIVAIDITSSAVFSANQTYKIALAYKSGSWAFYINGSLIHSGTQTFTFNNTLDRLLITGGTSATNTSEIFGKVSQTLLFPTRLTNTQLAELTTL